MISSNTLGRYRIVREIARSNDVVYEAVDPVMGRRVALKELHMPPNLVGAQRKERIDRFYREARAAGTLTHPNIVTIYEVGEQAGRHFIAMEYLEGVPLRDRLHQGPLPVREALRIAIAVAEALEYAHRHRVIHRDVKPDNVHLLPDGRIKLTDFGIARITFEPTLTIDGQIFGTPSYMSPEQVAGKQIDARSDLFSLGVMVYEMVTGRKPFVGESVITITYNIMNSEVPPHPALPPALNRVVRRALGKNPAQRFATAAEMAVALRNASNVLATGGAVQPGYPAHVPPGGAARPAVPGSGLRASPGVPQGYPATPGTAYPGGYAGGPGPAGAGSIANPGGTAAPLTRAPAGVPAGGAGNPFAHLSAEDLELPPLPRRQLLSDDTRWLLGWISVWLVIGLVIVGLVYVGKTAYDSARTGQATHLAGGRFRAAQDAYDRGDYAAARDEWLQAAKDPNLRREQQQTAQRNAAIASVQIGGQHKKTGQLADAERAYLEATAIYPYCGEAYTGLGSLASDRNDYTTAVSYFDRAVSVWNERLNTGGIPDEERQAISSKRDDGLASKALVLYNHGQQLVKQQQYAEADQKFGEAQMIAPNSPAARLAQQAQQRLPVGGGGIFPPERFPGY